MNSSKSTMTNTRTFPAGDLEARLAKAIAHLDVIAGYVAGPGADNDTMAAAFDTVVSLAQVAAAELRGEDPLR